MKASIPGSNRRILQDNKNPFNGNIAESFNLDLTASRGKFAITRTKKIADVEASSSTTQPVSAINQANGNLFYFGAEAGIDGIYEGNATAFSSTFVRDSTSADHASASSDLCINNATAYASESVSVWYSTLSSFGTWTEISSPALTANTPHLLTSLGDNTYVTNLDYKVALINSSNVLSLTNTGTCDFALPGYTITVFMTGLDRVWVGFSSLQSGQFGTTYIYEWDGESENAPNQRYEIDASGLIAGCVKDGVPYVLDTNGRLMKYMGQSFQEVARLPYKRGEVMAGFNSNQLNLRAIHPRAMTVDQDEILINVSNRIQGDDTANYWADFPAGVWAYSEENGLYHKYSSSYQAVADTGTTNMTDWGQMRVAQAGPIFVHDPIEQIQQSGEGGRVIFAQRYFTTADDDTESGDVDVTYKTALFADDTKENTQKWGYFITPELITENVVETWEKIYAKYKKLINSSDKVVVKYKTEKQEKTTADIAWVNTRTILTSTDVSGYAQGDEVQIIQGTGSGRSFHISSITSNGSSYTITLDDEFTGATGTAVAEFDNWKKSGEITYNASMAQWKELPIPKDNQSPVMQVKVCMQFTGKNELYGVNINSTSTIK